MSVKQSCNILVKKVFDSKKPKHVPKAEIKKNMNMHEAYIEKQKSHDSLRDGLESPSLWERTKGVWSSVRKNLIETEFNYLTKNKFGPVKYAIKRLQIRVNGANKIAFDSIKEDMSYTFIDEDGKETTKVLDNDSIMEVGMLIRANGNIEMYNHMNDGTKDYDGIYFLDDFLEILEDENTTGEIKKKLKSMHKEMKQLYYDQYLEPFRKRKTEPDTKTKRNMEERAEREAVNYTYIEGFLKEHRQMLSDRVTSNPATKQVYSNIINTRKDITLRASEAMRKAGRNIDNMFVYSPEGYYRAVFKDLKKAEHTKGRRNIFDIDMTTTYREGSNKSPNTNFFVSEMSYRSLMETEIAKAEFINNVQSNKNFDKTHELKDAVDSAVRNSLGNFATKLNDKSLEPNEAGMVHAFIEKFNQVVGERYRDLHMDYKDIYEKREWVHNGKVKTGNVFEQLMDHIDTAISNESNIIRHMIQRGDYDKQLTKYPQFRYIKDGNPSDRDIVMFGNFFAKGETKLFNQTKFTKFRELQQGLRNTTMSLMDFDFRRDILTPNSKGPDGSRRVLVNDMGTTLKGLDTQKVFKTLDEIATDGGLSEEEKAQMMKEYDHEYNKNMDILAEEFGEGKDKSFYDDEATFLALEEMQSKYNPTMFKSLYYADAGNATAMTKEEIQKTFLSNISSKKVERETERNIAMSNGMLQDIIDGNIRFMEDSVARAIGQVQIDLQGRDNSKDGPGMKVLKTTTRWSKFGLLYSPFKYPKFMLNNAIGDFTLALHNRPKSAMKTLNPLRLKEHIEKFYQLNEKSFNERENYFLENSQGFQMKNYLEILNDLDKESKQHLIGFQKELNDMGKSKMGVAKSLFKFNKLFGGYANKVTKLSEAREMYLRLEVFNEVMDEIEKTGAVKHYGTVQREAVQGILDEANKQTDIEKKKELQRQAGLVYANQALIMYDDLSRFSDNMSSYGMPFIRYAEGNIRAHYRLFNNFLKEYQEAIKQGDVSQIAKTTGRAGMSGAVISSVPIAIWNAIQMAMAGVDEEDIPEYAKEQGYFMLGNSFVTNTDVFGDFASNFGFENLRYNLGQNIKDEGLLNGIMGGISESWNDGGVKGIFNTTVNYTSPILKAPFELATAQDLFPSGTSYVGDKYSFTSNAGRKALTILGMDRAFEMAYNAMDDETKMYKGPLEILGFKISGDDMNEYFLARDSALAYGEDVLGKVSRTGQGYNDKDPKQKLRYGIYKAIKNQDEAFAEKLFTRYVEHIGEITTNQQEFDKEVQSLKQSLQTYFDVIPSYAVPQKEMENYVSSLSEAEYNRLTNAYMNQQELLGMYYKFIYGE